ncbi:MAG: endonuclease V, partial [Candidatus Eisenbacteria bacterium]|nr:endonuclease V [Candidatus Eisenbacteria bacterium]
WNLPPRQAAALQRRLAARVVRRGGPLRPRLVAGADIACDRESDRLYAAVLLLDAKTLAVREEMRASGPSRFPYVPGLLSFREAPLLLRAFRMLREEPDLILFDGQGIAHPRGFGLASHVGLLLDRPSIGCAKSLLVGVHGALGHRRGEHSDIRYEGRVVGSAVRTRDGVRPVYVSVGHRTSLPLARRHVLACCRGYRLPEPTRLAHIAVEKMKREHASHRASG